MSECDLENIIRQLKVKLKLLAIANNLKHSRYIRTAIHNLEQYLRLSKSVDK
jgi:hypothetical protein